MAENKLTEQINVRLSPETLGALDDCAQHEKRSRGEIARIILDWAASELRRHGLSRTFLRRRRAASSEELQSDLHSALDLLIERAPQTVVDRVAEFLTERAGKYGDEK